MRRLSIIATIGALIGLTVLTFVGFIIGCGLANFDIYETVEMTARDSKVIRKVGSLRYHRQLLILIATSLEFGPIGLGAGAVIALSCDFAFQRWRNARVQARFAQKNAKSNPGSSL